MSGAPGASRSPLRPRAERPRPGARPPSVAQRDARAGRWTGPPAARHSTVAHGRAVRGVLDPVIGGRSNDCAGSTYRTDVAGRVLQARRPRREVMDAASAMVPL